MQDNPNITSNNMEDISSTSAEFRAKKSPVNAYSGGIYKNLGNIIKIIAFILGFSIVLVCFLLSFLLFIKSMLSLVVSLAIILFGTAVAAVVFFLTFAIGQILCQNNEILKRLDEDR